MQPILHIMQMGSTYANNRSTYEYVIIWDNLLALANTGQH